MLAADGGLTDTVLALAELGADIHVQDNVSSTVSSTAGCSLNVNN